MLHFAAARVGCSTREQLTQKIISVVRGDCMFDTFKILPPTCAQVERAQETARRRLQRCERETGVSMEECLSAVEGAFSEASRARLALRAAWSDHVLALRQYLFTCPGCGRPYATRDDLETAHHIQSTPREPLPLLWQDHYGSHLCWEIVSEGQACNLRLKEVL
jgi:hypothetical protein